MEAWKPAPGWEHRLEVSSLGRIRSVDHWLPSKQTNSGVQFYKGKLKHPALAANGYYYVAAPENGKQNKLLVHRLVAKAFVEGEQDGDTVDHLNGVRTDNRAENLGWCSRRENTLRQHICGRVAGRGERHPSSRLTNEQRFEIIDRYADGTLMRELADAYGVSIGLVHKIIHRGKAFYRR